MAWRWVAVTSASRDLKKLDRQVAERIVRKLDFWAETGDPLRFAEYLKHSELGQYRFRVGDYRIIFDVEGDTIVVLAVGHRREIYK